MFGLVVSDSTAVGLAIAWAVSTSLAFAILGVTLGFFVVAAVDGAILGDTACTVFHKAVTDACAANLTVADIAIVPAPSIVLARPRSVGSRRSQVYAQLEEPGHVLARERDARPVYPAAVVAFVASYAIDHPCFYVEEMLAEVKRRFPGQRRGLSPTCVLRLLRFELNLSRKVLERRAREALPFEVDRTWRFNRVKRYIFQS
ncbi:hypothetical protein PI124_g17715 [Phytophthora idaei]|nr:hypothetical protein PI124_g17715 [Phytophthora idaei]